MAKQKLSLTASPTFKCTVGIPIPGAKETVPVEFIFIHRTKSELKVWRESIELEPEGVTAAHVQEMAKAWDLDDVFDESSITAMLEQYPGSGTAIYVRYLQESQDAKLGNFGK